LDKEYELVYLASFRNSLREIRQEWRKLGISEESIARFIKRINTSLEYVEYNPEMFPEVSDRYVFLVPTYRISVGKTYAIFYRIIEDSKQILVGSMFHQKQVKVKF
jgi:plasmid stabilization system protein ParE